MLEQSADLAESLGLIANAGGPRTVTNASETEAKPEPGAAPAPGSNAAPPKDERVAGAYEVPTSAELAEFATNPVRVRLRALEGDDFELKYHLPEVIAGIDREVDLVATKTDEGSWQLAASRGVALVRHRPRETSSATSSSMASS